jgi:FkbM family methyltransferase
MQIKQKIKKLETISPNLYVIVKKIYRFFSPRKSQKEIYKKEIQKNIKEFLKNKSSVFFIQVGSNDGLQGDSIRDLIINDESWSGIFIEPVGFIFQNLKRNYGNKVRFIFENVAIAEKKGYAKFYYVSEQAKVDLGDKLPYWYDQLGTFDKNHILKHCDGELEPYIVEEDIECLPLQDILTRNNVQAIDLLHIDTEGYDYKVLSQVDFVGYKPLVMLYENTHLGVEERQKAELLLKTNDYRVTEYGGDTLAILQRSS